MRKPKNKKAPSKDKASFLGAAGKNQTYKDLKRKAIALGMPFPDATGCGIFDLIRYINGSDNTPDKSLIDAYDEWIDKSFEEKGFAKDDPIRSSRLRLGFLGDEDEETGKRKTKRVPGMKKPKEKKAPREKDEFGLVQGTKKSYVFGLVKKGYDMDRVNRRTKKKFPEANDKSIQLWFRTAKRYMKAHGIETGSEE